MKKEPIKSIISKMRFGFSNGNILTNFKFIAILINNLIIINKRRMLWLIQSIKNAQAVAIVNHIVLWTLLVKAR